jgi:hypothetical protein
MMTRERWLALAILAITIVFTLCLIALLDDAEGGRGEAAPPPVPSKWDDHIDALEVQALDEAFKQHIVKLFGIWVVDNYQPRIPPKALTGARNARDAYVRSREAIEKREQLPR